MQILNPFEIASDALLWIDWKAISIQKRQNKLPRQLIKLLVSIKRKLNAVLLFLLVSFWSYKLNRS
jgi:hypothetical protein